MPFYHPEVEVIADGHPASRYLAEPRSDAIEIVDAAKSQIDPLCDAEQIGYGMGVLGLQSLQFFLCPGQQLEAVGDAPVDQRRVQFVQQTLRKRHAPSYFSKDILDM